VAQSRLTDALGRVLGGRYRLVAPLGVGASAQVFLADDVRLRRRVAVKMLHVALADDHDFLRRFQAEAQAAAALNHPHVMAVYDWGQDDVPYLVLEYLGGGSIRGMLDKGRLLSPAQALRVGLEAGRALEYAHNRGLVHRDIKPANLLFGEEGRLRIADFGLARALAEAAWTEPQGAVLGTARYAAPEQARGELLDGRADVYALALVLVEAVTGQVPFAADTTIGTLMARVNRPLEVPEELGPLRAVLERAGTPDPADRLDAHGFVTALLATARELAAPEPLPLVGTAATDPEVPLVDPDPTQIPGAAIASVVPGLAGDGTEAAERLAFSPPALDPDATQATATPGGLADTTALVGAVPSLYDHAVDDTDAGPAAVAPTPPDRGGRSRRIGRRLGISVLVLLLLAGFGVGVALGYKVLKPTPSYVVPASVRDVNVLQAQAAVDKLGHHWKTRIEHTRRDGTTKNTVIDTRPIVGKKLARGKTLVLVVSDGQTLVKLPDGLAGKSYDEDAAALTAAGLSATRVDTFDNTIPNGVVMSVGDGKTNEYERGTQVPVTVSKGHAPVQIPNGLAKSDPTAVSQSLQTLGFRVVQAQDYSTTVPKGLVIGTDPAGGSTIPFGSTVKVIVSLGPKPVQVPSIAGSPDLQDANARLVAAGLVPGTVVGPATGVPVAYSPGSGSTVPQGTSVNIILG